ncbi:MAG: ferritin family protein [Spirochaetaceae bacterium]|nr:ferritin family protein [Spirochaetaceae bacterium]
MDVNKNFLKVEELLDLAITFEQDSADYYRTLQKHVENSRVLEMLKTLELQEIEHRDTLKDFALEDKPYPLLQFGPSFNIALPEIESESPSLQELLDVAIEREIVSRQIYSNTADQVFGNLAQVLQDLAAFEGEHEAKLKDLRAFLTGEDRT